MTRLNELTDAYDKVDKLADQADQTIRNDYQAIGELTGTLGQIEARLKEVPVQRAAILERIATLHPDTVPGDAMVGAYLQSQLEQLQSREQGLNTSKAQYIQAIADAQRKLVFDQGIRERLQVQLEELYRRILDV